MNVKPGAASARPLGIFLGRSERLDTRATSTAILRRYPPLVPPQETRRTFMSLTLSIVALAISLLALTLSFKRAQDRFAHRVRHTFEYFRHVETAKRYGSVFRQGSPVPCGQCGHIVANYTKSMDGDITCLNCERAA